MEQTYAMRNNDLLLGVSHKKYVLKVRDLPSEEKPRERLLAHGPSALSAQELMAVLLSAGTRKEEVLAMSARMRAMSSSNENGFVR